MQNTVQNYIPTEGFRLQPEGDPPGSSLYLLNWHQPVLPHRRALFQGVPGAAEITQSTRHAYLNTQDQKLIKSQCGGFPMVYMRSYISGSII